MASETVVDDTPVAPGSDDEDTDARLSDNTVEYLIFHVDNKTEAKSQLSRLEAIRQSALKLVTSLSKDYIWQKDEFNIELKNKDGLVYLHGITDYGDAVEDEWYIVYMLRELSRSNPNVWIRVLDTDGEFLLVEAANVLPKWLNPEIDQNRVWIHQGKLLIIPLKNEKGLESRNLTLHQAAEVIKSNPNSLVHSTFIEAEAFYRLEKYPGQINDSIHHSVVTIPRKVACILHALPKAIAPAVETFYLRDPIALNRVISPTTPLIFSPVDLVKVSVRFSKVLFAQLRSQRFDTPSSWRGAIQKVQKETTSSEAEKDLAKLDIGMKLTCGFEMLAVKAEKSKNRVVREFAIELDDLQEDGDDVLPSDDEIKSWKDVTRDDSEAWLDINLEDFERELEGRQNAKSQGAGTGFGDVKTQEDLRKIVSRFESFLNDDDAGVEGAELDDMDYDDDDDDDDDEDDDSDDNSEFEDKEISFDEEEFSKMMREMMGLPSSNEMRPSQTKGKAPAQSSRLEENGENDQEDDEEISKLATEMEAELNQHGALKLDPATEKSKRIKDKETGGGNDDEDQDSEAEVDIDFNLAKNLLESFKSQGGMAGPTGNLLGMMGIQLPRDEDDGKDDDGDDETESSQRRGAK